MDELGEHGGSPGFELALKQQGAQKGEWLLAASIEVSDGSNPPIAAVARPVASFNERRRNRPPVLAPSPVRAGESKTSGGYTGLAEPGSLAHLGAALPEVCGAWPGSGNSSCVCTSGPQAARTRPEWPSRHELATGVA